MNDVVKRYGVSASALQRHRARHIPLAAREAAAAAAAADDAEHGGDLLATARRLLREADSILNESRSDRDRRSAIAAIREASRLTELLGKLHGTINDGVQINLMAAPALSDLVQTVLLLLAPFPEARLAVANGLAGQRPMLEHDADYTAVASP